MFFGKKKSKRGVLCDEMTSLSCWRVVSLEDNHFPSFILDKVFVINNKTNQLKIKGIKQRWCLQLKTIDDKLWEYQNQNVKWQPTGYSIWSPCRGIEKFFQKWFYTTKISSNPWKLTLDLLLEVDLNSNHPLDFSVIFKLPLRPGLEDRWDLENTPWKTDHLVPPWKVCQYPLYGLQME